MGAHLPRERLRKLDQCHDTPYDLVKLMGDAGLLGIPFPEDYGGSNLGWLLSTLVQERLAYHAGVAAQLYSFSVEFGGSAILHHGTVEQKAELLPPLIK